MQKFYEFTQTFEGLTINELAVHNFVSDAYPKHEMTAYFYYPNIKKLSVYVCSAEYWNKVSLSLEYLHKVVYHLPIEASDIIEAEKTPVCPF